MHLFRRSQALGAVLFAVSGAVFAQARAIPDTLEVLEVVEADALQKMRRCNPRVSQEDLNRMLERQAKNDTTTLTSIAGNDDAAAVVEKGGLWACIQMSPQRYPMLPVDTVAEAAKPGGADPERTKAFHLAIARSLAETGFARGLITYAETGNATAVFYAVSADKPGELAFESRFLKKGEFNADEYSLRLDDPNTRSILTTSQGRGNTRRDVFLGKYPPRQVVDGYLIRKGNERTARFEFAGTTWKSPTALGTTYSFQKEGVLVYRGKAGTSFGSWKLQDGVLYFEVNKYSFYSALLDERDYLIAEARNTPRGLTPALAGAGAPTENRFKARLFQEGNTAAEKEARDKLDNAYKALETLLTMRKNEILNESAEPASGPQAGARKFQTLCEGQMLPMAVIIAEQKGMKSGDLCMSFSGTRAEWKATVLKDGCQGRCLPF